MPGQVVVKSADRLGCSQQKCLYTYIGEGVCFATSADVTHNVFVCFVFLIHSFYALTNSRA
jgi:hypothetical protein